MYVHVCRMVYERADAYLRVLGLKYALVGHAMHFIAPLNKHGLLNALRKMLVWIVKVLLIWQHYIVTTEFISMISVSVIFSIGWTVNVNAIQSITSLSWLPNFSNKLAVCNFQ